MGSRHGGAPQWYVSIRNLRHSQEELLLIRDRMGVKPLFYYPMADDVLFGSDDPVPSSVQPQVALDGLREVLVVVRNPERRGQDALLETCRARTRA